LGFISFSSIKWVVHFSVFSNSVINITLEKALETDAPMARMPYSPMLNSRKNRTPIPRPGKKKIHGQADPNGTWVKVFHAK
jgi:hypothetical protein